MKETAMIEEEVKMEAAQKLQILIQKQLQDFYNEANISNKQDIVLSVFQNLLVQVLIGNQQTISIFFDAYKLENHQHIIPQSLFLKWLCTQHIKQDIITRIQQEYKKIGGKKEIQKKIIENSIEIKRQASESVFISHHQTFYAQQKEMRLAPIQAIVKTEAEHISEEIQDIFDVINLQQSDVEQWISGNQQHDQQILLYSHEQMCNQLELQLDKTPAKTIVTHEEQAETFKHEQAPEQQQKSQGKQPQQAKQPQQDKLVEQLQDERMGVGKDGENASVNNDELINDSTLLSDSQLYGHFLYGDKVEAIVDVLYHQDQVYYAIQWKNRSNGTQLKNSTLSSSTLKFSCPQVLIKFYQQKLKKMGE